MHSCDSNIVAIKVGAINADTRYFLLQTLLVGGGSKHNSYIDDLALTIVTSVSYAGQVTLIHNLMRKQFSGILKFRTAL